MATERQEMVYESPKVEVIEVVIEQGFAASPGSSLNPGNPGGPEGGDLPF